MKFIIRQSSLDRLNGRRQAPTIKKSVKNAPDSDDYIISQQRDGNFTAAYGKGGVSEVFNSIDEARDWIHSNMKKENYRPDVWIATEDGFEHLEYMSKPDGEIKKSFGESFGGWDDIQKALSHKYIRRIPKKTGKGYWYIYKETFLKPFAALKMMLGMTEKKITETYEANGIKKEYGADKQTFAAHVLEYMTNKLKWDTIFSNKENRAKYAAPQKMARAKQSGNGNLTDTDGQGALFDTAPEKGNNNKTILNRSLMRRVWAIYNNYKEDANEGNHAGIGQGELSFGTEAVRGGGSEEDGNKHVPETIPQRGSNGGASLQLSLEFGERTGRDVRLTAGQAKDIRAACVALLDSKTDAEMTAADKDLLRQYEGAGGLGSEDASVHGTLYEFYTPRTVTGKVWEIVDKYLPGAKNVLEPSAGVGRFAENRPNDRFTLNEYDATSARISGILHPGAEVRNGAFQEFFRPGKSYDGKKFDVVIGNPPYGTYAGLWKGRGEGKEHSRYEEYFIDRGLDTLRDGGIMAFVVPSGFLRGKNSKVKEKIAGKGRLLEAWRLPNGTFNTTGVGTDIVIIRKEKGDAAAFSDNSYFNASPQNVVGTETTRSGRFGEEKYVALNGDDTFDSAVARIDAGAVPAIPAGELAPQVEAEKAVKVKESVAEAHKNRSDAMLGNQNARKDGLMDEATAKEAKSNADFLDSPGPRKWAEIEAKSAALKKETEAFIESVHPYARIAPRDKDGNIIDSIMVREHREKEVMHSARDNDRDERTRKRLLARQRELNKDAEAFHKSPESKFDYQRYYELSAGVKSIRSLSSVLSNGKTQTISRSDVGKISIEKGKTGKDGYGLLHIIESRAVKDGADADTIAALLWLVKEAVKDGELSKSGKVKGDRFGLEKDGILAVIAKNEAGQFVLTGYDVWGKEKEAADAIKTVIAKYGYTPEFSDFRKQVGAALASLSVSPNSDKESSAEAHANRSAAMMGNQNAAGKHDLDSLEDFNRKYNKSIDARSLPIWKATRWDGGIETSLLDKASLQYLEDSGNYVKTADGKWQHILNFASGNIYDKLDALERDRDSLSKTEYEKQKALLEAAKPAPKSVLEIDFNPLSDMSDKFTVSGGDTLNGAFKAWIRKAPEDELALTGDAGKADIIRYVNRESVRADKAYTDEDKLSNKLEAQRKITARREAADRLFNQFIREQLPLEDQKNLAEQYNRRYYGTAQADYTQMPLFLEGISKSFKGEPFTANESQIKTASWLANQGNGIVALDVGVGKTITAIMSAVNDIQMGRCSKPVITVPKAVYKNWINEIQELFPNVRINELGNFSDIGAYKNEDGTLNIEPGSISLCTYEALSKIGFKEDTVSNDFAEIFEEAIRTTSDADDEAAMRGSKSAQRKVAKDSESIMTKVGMASRAGDNWVNWEDTGFDHITVDEAHAFRNSFSKPRSKGKGDADEFRDVPGGSTSLRGLKLFAISQLIQKNNDGRNVHLLTATPFQNSPVEIYNMLSLVAREKLKVAGIMNFHEFLAQFAELKSELVVKASGEVVQKNVMKGFKNLGALQNLLNQYVMKVDGEDAGIIRPDKADHIIELSPTAEQRGITEKIRAYMESGPDPEKDPGATLRCLNALRQAALSPSLADGFKFLDPGAAGKAGIEEREVTVENRDFVQSSPKMTFICDTAADIYRQHPDKGQIIHLPQGVRHYGEVRDYLVSKGVPKDSIAFLALEYLKPGDAGNDQKEEITRAFNDPANKLKIIIGSDTIKEGVNLNGNTIQTYEAMLAWNPTDTQQLKGRSWRQGNKQGKVHITFPLMNDSVDSFMYQKHDEKGSRLDTLWNSTKDKIDVGGIDPEELKFSLIKDPEKRANLYIKEKTAELSQKKKVADSISDKIANMAGQRRDLQDEIDDAKEQADTLKNALAEFNAKSDAGVAKEYRLLFAPGGKNYSMTDAGFITGNTMKEWRTNYTKAVKDKISDHQKTAQRNKGKVETIDNTLARYGITNPANKAQVERARQKYSAEGQEYGNQIEAIRANREQYIKEASEQIRKEARPGLSVSAAVAENTKAVTGDLYSFDVVREREEKKKGVFTKALVIGNRIILKAA